MIGPGKYDLECTQVRLGTMAGAVLVLVIGGDRGSGFSLQGPPAIVTKLPAILRDMAEQIESGNN